MKKALLHIVFLFMLFSVIAQGESWKAKRISTVECQNESNTWIDFRRDIEIETVPGIAIAKITCDSKYWLWVNGEMSVFEGQLKRGPSPDDTYYDEVDIAPLLKKGNNTIAILTWYFGKDGFSHNSSGQAGLVFECDALHLYSDEKWLSRLDKAFEKTDRPHPNYRLPESNVRFDARMGNFDWVQPDGEISSFRKSNVIGEAESTPWNNLVLRPIPLWKDFGTREYENSSEIPSEGTGEWIVCQLPYNCHITPLLDIEAPAGLTIKMQTDNYDYLGLERASVRAEYVSREGAQQYESLGWMNGHVVKYFIPKGVKINSLKYRETGFDCEFSGYFNCSDTYYERLWQKAVRTLYVTMRDTYMDCPDRERAQWWGDLVNESGEAFYALSPPAATLTQKGILELIAWQREDGTIYAPVPEGNWNRELPGQMLASIGYYGFWNYYINTGDRETIAKVYDGVKKYLDVWQLKENGTLVERTGDWYWGDWGKKVDKQLLFNAWYYLALKGYANMSEILERESELIRIRKEMEAFRTAFNEIFWDGRGYKTEGYEDGYDDRAQALALVSGLADAKKHQPLLKIFKNSFLASPYMEKYVLEALFMMGEEAYGLQRMKKRFWSMVEESNYTTLYENFGIENIRAGSGTNNHAWSGGGLTILSQYVCGLEPIEPAWKTFKVKPHLGKLEFAATGNETVAGKVAVKIKKSRSAMSLELLVPAECNAIVYIPEKYPAIKVNGEMVYDHKPHETGDVEFLYKEEGFLLFKVGGGEYSFNMTKH